MVQPFSHLRWSLKRQSANYNIYHSEIRNASQEFKIKIELNKLENEYF